MTTIGERLRTLRLHHRLTQAQLGERVGISSQAVSDIETGATQATSKLAELARALGTTAEWLRYGDQVRECRPSYQADLDRLHELITTGRIDPKTVAAIRQMAEALIQ